MLSSFVEPRWWQKSGRRPSHNTKIAVARILGDGKRQRTRVFTELQVYPALANAARSDSSAIPFATRIFPRTR